MNDTAVHATFEGEWLSLAALVNFFGHDDCKKRHLLDSLREKRCRYRYFLGDPNGYFSGDPKNVRYDDLPEDFWKYARVYWIFSVAIFGSLIAQGVEVLVNSSIIEIGPAKLSGLNTGRPEPSGIDPFRTGASGRPTSSHLVLEEAKRRIAAGE